MFFYNSTAIFRAGIFADLLAGRHAGDRGRETQNRPLSPPDHCPKSTNTTSGGLNRRGIGQGAVLDSPREITILPYLPR